MYENPGSKLKGVATVFFVIGIIIALLAAIGVYRTLDSITYKSGMPLLIAIIVFVISCLLSWLSYLRLYAFGELVEKVCQIESTVQKLQKNAIPVPTPAPAPTPAPKRTCPVCGQLQPDGKFCGNCGAEIP